MAQEKAPASAEEFFKYGGVVVEYPCCRLSKKPRVVNKTPLKKENGCLDLSSLAGTNRLPTKQTVRS